MKEELSTREKIIEVGAEIIVKEGLRKFTAKNIANKLGITDAALFKHFKSMDDIILEIINRYITRCLSTVDIALKEGKNTKEKLELVLKAHFEVLEETRGAVPVLCFEFSRSQNAKFFDILKGFVENYRCKLAEIIRQGQEEDIVREDLDPDDTAMLFLGIIQAKVFAYVMAQKTGPIVENPDLLISQLFYGILKR